jgi:recombination protein RecT
VIHANDKHRIVFGTHPILEHEPTLLGDPGEVICAYAIATFADGSQQVEVVTGPDLDKVRAMAAQGGPWKGWYDEMARKTAIRRLCKFLPYEPELDRAIEVSHAADGGDDDSIVVDVIGAGSRAKALTEKIRTPEPVQADADGAVAQ